MQNTRRTVYAGLILHAQKNFILSNIAFSFIHETRKEVGEMDIAVLAMILS